MKIGTNWDTLTIEQKIRRCQLANPRGTYLYGLSKPTQAQYAEIKKYDDLLRALLDEKYAKQGGK